MHAVEFLLITSVRTIRESLVLIFYWCVGRKLIRHYHLLVTFSSMCMLLYCRSSARHEYCHHISTNPLLFFIIIYTSMIQ